MSAAMEDWPRRHRITVDEYHRMAESGSFAPDAVNDRLHVFRNPISDQYAEVLSVEQPGLMDITALPGASVDLSSLFRDA